MSRILLKPVPEPKTDLSHFHRLVSAYQTNDESVEDLAVELEKAVQIAREKCESVVVDQDCLDHVFIVHPNAIGLYRLVSTWEVVKR